MLETSPAAVVVVWALTARWRGCADVNRQRAAVRDASQYHVNTRKQASKRTHARTPVSIFSILPCDPETYTHTHAHTEGEGGGPVQSFSLSPHHARNSASRSPAATTEERPLCGPDRAGPNRTEQNNNMSQRLPPCVIDCGTG